MKKLKIYIERNEFFIYIFLDGYEYKLVKVCEYVLSNIF